MFNHRMHACHAATTVVREASRLAYTKHKRGMIASDLLSEISLAFDKFCPA